MNTMQRLLLFLGIFVIAPAALSQQLGSTSSPKKITLNESTQAPSAEEAAQQKLLLQAIALIHSGKAEDAIDGPDTRVLEYFHKRYDNNSGTRYFAARTEAETLLYLAEAAKQHQTAVVLPVTWAQAWFIKGSALNGLGHYNDAIDAIQKALALSPWNSMYLTELGYSYEMTHHAHKALALCQQAAAAAELSPENVKRAEQTRALRCEGFNFTNLHRYDDAIKQYQAALKLDPDDAKSKHELDYIKLVREGRVAQPIP